MGIDYLLGHIFCRKCTHELVYSTWWYQSGKSIWLFKDILYYKMNVPEFSWHFKAADEYILDFALIFFVFLSHFTDYLLWDFWGSDNSITILLVGPDRLENIVHTMFLPEYDLGLRSEIRSGSLQYTGYVLEYQE